jgi:cholesterol transport system auxiliary component
MPFKTLLAMTEVKPHALLRAIARASSRFGPGSGFRACLPLLLAGLAACTSVTDRREPQALYDLGVPDAASATPAGAPGQRFAPLAVGDISVPSWMDSTRIFYRLDYDNPLQARSYSQARWTMPPSRLFLQRLKTRLAQAGVPVLGAGDGAIGIAQLRIDADDFSQVFESATKSSARIALRVSLLQDRKLVAQKSFIAKAPANTPDAAGGVLALTAASDVLAADLTAWLSTLPLAR